MSPTQLARKTDAEPHPPELEILGRMHAAQGPRPDRKVWIDLENSPHVPFFGPIIKELEGQGCEVVLTARDCFQVCELADMAGLKYRKIGRHYGKNRIAKLVGLGIRVLQLIPFALQKKPAISICHGSRSLILVSAV